MPTANEVAIVLRARDQLTATMRQAQQQIRALQPATAAADRGLRGMGGAARTAQTGVRALTVSLNTLAKAAVVLGVFQRLAQAFGAAKDAAIGFNASLEQQSIAFETMLGSAERSQAFLMDLQRFAATTPFEFPELVTAAQRMLAMGFSAGQVLPLLTDVGNATAALGTGREGIDRITRALGQMQARLRVSAEEMLQLTEAGIPAWQILADAIGKSVPETIKLTEKGKIASSVFIKAFQDFSKLKFGDMMARQAQTFDGAMSTIFDSLRFAGSVAFKPIFDRIRDLAIRIAEFVQSDQFGEWATRVSVHVEIVLRALGALASGFQRALTAIARIVLSIGTIILKALNLINPFARHSPSLVEQVQAGLGEIKEQFAGLPAAVGPQMQKIGQRMAWLREQMSGGGMGGEAHVEALGRALETQERAIRAAELALRPYEVALEGAQRKVDALGEALRAAESDLRRFQSAPLEGERAFDDALFANSQAAAKLRLQLAELEARGQEGQGFVGRVRFGRQRAAIEQRLRQLANEEERTRLQRQLTIDPQRRALERIGQPPEVSFVEAMKGAQAAFNRIQQLGPAFAAAQVETERMATDLKAQQDALQAQKDALAIIQNQYQAIADAAKAAKGGKDEGFAFGPVDLAGMETASAGLDAMLTKMEGLREELLANMTPGLEQFETTINNLVTPLETLADRIQAAAGAGKTLGEAFGAAWREAQKLGTNLVAFFQGLGGERNRPPDIQDFFPGGARPGDVGGGLERTGDAANELGFAIRRAVTPAVEAVTKFLTALAEHLRVEIPKAADAFKKAWDKSVMAELIAFELWWKSPGTKTAREIAQWLSETTPASASEFEKALKIQVLGPLGAFVDWWENKQGKQTTQALIHWMEADTPAGAQRFYDAMQTSVMGPLGQVAKWWQDHKDDLAAFAAWFEVEAPRGVKAFQEAIRGIGPAIDDINRAMQRWIEDRLKPLLQLLERIKQTVDALTGRTPSGAGGGGSGGFGGGATPAPAAPVQTVPGRGGALPAFQHGGSFRVGGSGGPDSQLVAFMASPKERVTISPPGSGGGGGLTINGPLIGSVVVQSEADERRLVDRIEQMLAERWQASTAQGVRAPIGVVRVN